MAAMVGLQMAARRKGSIQRVNSPPFCNTSKLQLLIYLQRDYDVDSVVVITIFCGSHPMHCKENPIYVLPEKKLRGLSPNLHIQVSMSVLYIPTIGPPIFLQQNRQTDRDNI
jgi:hypothetical protein